MFMQKIPVTLDGKRGSDIMIIDAEDVVKIDKLRDRVYLVHTADSQYYLEISLESIEEWLFEDGFRLLDSTNIVNMNHVSRYDVKKGLVYFGNPDSRNAKTASVARIHKEHIENVLEILHSAQSQDDSPEVSFQEWIQSKQPREDDRFLRSYATIYAMNERKKAQDKIMHMAYHDSLTNLPNRLLYYERLNQSFEETKKNGKMSAIIFLDLDRFKNINDTLGHHVGDRLLESLAQKLKIFVSDNLMIARFGGDEFMILMTNVSHIDEVKQFARKIPELFQEPFLYEKHELSVTASIGIAMYPHDGTDADTLIKNADVAMYRAKQKGGNTYQLYHPEMNKRSLHRLNLEIHLRRAVERNEFIVYYQPLVDLQSGEIFGMESLVRWAHPEWGMISPVDFIPIAEETGVIIQLGNWVLKQACLQNYYWQQMGYPELCISVNISANQFQQPDFIQNLESTLEITGLPPHLLCLEITETVAMQNVSYMMDTMDKLKRLGVKISIDDFGTGYSSLSYLKRFRVHTLKIDKSFIRDVTVDEDNAAIVNALIAMSQRLKIRTLAEGVETREQLEFLRRQGCNEIQGYIFSGPLPAAEFEQLLKQKKNLYAMLQD
jgi:diguanylate cyclase (GGDEF)-like protein